MFTWGTRCQAAAPLGARPEGGRGAGRMAGLQGTDGDAARAGAAGMVPERSCSVPACAAWRAPAQEKGFLPTEGGDDGAALYPGV